MRNYTIARLQGELNWGCIPALQIDTLLWSEPLDVTAGAQLCYDDEAVHVRLFAKEEHIRAEENGETGMPCEDSCLEFFFCPVPGDMRYFNIEYNPNCCLYLGMGHSMDDLVRLLPQESPFKPAAQRTADGWEVVYSIPHSFVKLFFPEYRAESGVEIRANCFKCGDLTPQLHFFSWNPCTSETPCFHKSDDFGLMRFE